MSEYRVVIAPSEKLAAELGIALDDDALTQALDVAGYVRLDGRGEPGGVIAFIQKDLSAGTDDGSRDEALQLARALVWIARADGPLTLADATRIADETLTLATTDGEGRRLVLALASYAREGDRPQGVPRMPTQITTPLRLAKAACAVAGRNGVSTDIAIERAIATGRGIDGWADVVWEQRPLTEPLVRLRRHDPSRYERLGLAPDLAEVISWVEAHPDTDAATLERHAAALGIDRLRLAGGIARARMLAAAGT